MSAQPYGETFALLRAGCRDAWRDYTYHDFVNGLSDGSLPHASFVKYLIQDYVFLVHFARAWSLAVVKAETLDEMQVCASIVSALLEHEMALHVQTWTLAQGQTSGAGC